MKNYLLFLFGAIGICLFSSSCKEYTCEDFKTGNYVFADTAFSNMSLSRTLTGTQDFDVLSKGEWVRMTKEVGEQIEVEVKDGKSITKKQTIIWDGPCSYSLVFKETDSPKDVYETKYDTFRVSITNIEKNEYDFRARVANQHVDGRLIKVE